VSEPSVRQAVFSDLPDLVPLFDAYRQFYGRTPDLAAAESFLRDRFSHGESVLFLAFAADEPAGFTQLYPSFSSVSLARTFILNDLFVVPSQRRAGVGSALLRAAVDYARSLGAVRVHAVALPMSFFWRADRTIASSRRASARATERPTRVIL